MGRLIAGMLVLGLVVGLAVGLTRDAQGPIVPRLERAITKDARKRFGRVKRTRCVRYQRDASRFSCTAIQFESALSYTGQVYVAQVFPDGRFRYRPYKIPIWLGV